MTEIVVQPIRPEQHVGRLLSAADGKRRVVLNLAWMWGHRCFYCGRNLNLDLAGCGEGITLPPDYPTVDHHIAKNHGGRNVMSNLRLACPRCNHLKADHSTEHNTAVPWEPGAPSASCPMCAGTGYHEASAKICEWCDGRGALTVEFATQKCADLLAAVRSYKHTQNRKNTEIGRLRDLITQAWDDPNGWRDRKGLLDTIHRQRVTIGSMAKAFSRDHAHSHNGTTSS